MKININHSLLGSKKAHRILVSVVCAIAIVLAVMPWYAGYLQNKSLRQAELGFHVDALHTAQSAAKLNPLSVDGLFVLAGAQQRIGRIDEARRTMMRATRLEPENYLVWEQLAVYERDRWGEPDLAREHFERALRLNPLDRQLRERAGEPPLE